ncbi:MAG: hypothetical protein HWN67_11835 [Candidatus Helarchaeota archaeon]|nr:hypothetical protein [Candidatus Helarchaeota archaeon]
MTKRFYITGQYEKCGRIKDKLIKLTKENIEYKELNQKIYIHIKALLVFEPERWVPDLLVPDIIEKLDFYKKNLENRLT